MFQSNPVHARVIRSDATHQSGARVTALASNWATLRLTCGPMPSLMRISKNAGRSRMNVAMFFFATTVAAITVGETAMAAAPFGGRSASHQGRKKLDRARTPRAEDRAPDAPPPRRRIVVFPFSGDDGALSSHVGRLLTDSGFVVLTDVKPVERTEQYREVANTLQLMAFVEGEVTGTEEMAKAVIRLRSGASGRKMVEASFKGKLDDLPAQLTDRLLTKLSPSFSRECIVAARPRRKTRGALVINAGTEIETIPAPPKPAATDDAAAAAKAKARAAERKVPVVADRSSDDSA